MKTDKKTVGERLKYYRELAGLSQEELGRIVGYRSRSAIYNIEKNRSGIPAGKIQRLADILGISSEELLGTSEHEYIYSQKENKFNHITIDLSDIEDPNFQKYVWESLKVLGDRFKKSRSDEILIYDLSDYSPKQRNLIKNLMDSTLNQF